MIFGLFKKPVPRARVLDDLVEMLEKIRETIDTLMTDEGVSIARNYPTEASAFLYILGWYAIQSSGLSLQDKHCLCAELTGRIAQRMGGRNPTEQTRSVHFLQTRVAVYRQALEDGKGRDWAAKLVFRFLAYLHADTLKYVAIQAALYAMALGDIGALIDFLTEIGRTHKLV